MPNPCPYRDETRWFKSQAQLQVGVVANLRMVTKSRVANLKFSTILAMFNLFDLDLQQDTSDPRWGQVSTFNVSKTYLKRSTWCYKYWSWQFSVAIRRLHDVDTYIYEGITDLITFQTFDPIFIE